MENKEEKFYIPPYSKIKVEWQDHPHNYSKEAKNRIRQHFASKYGVNKSNINVIYKPIKFNDKGEVIEITGAGIENIMDVNYQRALMKEIISRDGKKIDFNRIVALDDKVNGELNVDLTVSQHRSWSIKWIMIDNFLSFGEQNYIPFSKLKGLTIVNSIPSNEGGKTTLTIDAIKFLLHGTTTKTDKNIEIFNAFTDKNELVVRGMVDIENDEIIIERKLRRTPKKSGGWTVSNTVKYYIILPDGEEKNLNEEDAKVTTKKIKETIGSEKDFELLVLATESNLDDLIGLTTSESGKILTRLIGLEILELKEGCVRTMYSEFSKKKKSNEYDVVTLTTDIVDHETKISEGDELEKSLKTKLEETKKEIVTLNNDNDRLLNSKEKVDVNISELNTYKLGENIALLINKGVGLKEKVEKIEINIKNIGTITFDEDKHYELTNNLTKCTSSKAVKEAEVSRLERVISGLIAGGVCQACNRKLDDVDNTEHINKHQKEIDGLNNNILVISEEILVLNSDLTGLNEIKKLIDEKNKLELGKDRAEVEMGGLRNDILSKRNELKNYNLNLVAIELNRKVDIEVSMVKTNLVVKDHSKDDLLTRLERVQSDIKVNKVSIETKTKLIEVINKEEEVDKIFKVYIELVGKKGISKLVLRSVLPIINSEVQRLLEDVSDFDIEIFMNDKNDVDFLITRNGISKRLKSGSGFEKTASSLALRGVLGKISTLPMPNFITFDEVLGKVSVENFDKIKLLFDKIKDMYDIVFFITHNDIVKDWSNNIVTVIKENNVSRVKIS